MGDETTNSTSAPGATKAGSTLAETIKNQLPSIIMAIIGFIIWYGQTNIQRAVDDNSRQLQVQMAASEELYKRRLSLSEDYYKRRLDAYDATCKEMAAFKDALDTVDTDQVAAAKRIAALDQFQRANALYLSKELDDDLTNLWTLGVNIMQHPDEDNEQWKTQIPDTIMLSHNHMKEDLKLKELIEALGPSLLSKSDLREPAK